MKTHKYKRKRYIRESEEIGMGLILYDIKRCAVFHIAERETEDRKREESI